MTDTNSDLLPPSVHPNTKPLDAISVSARNEASTR